MFRQLGGLLVASADVLDDAVGPDVDGFAVPGVDPVGEVAVVRRLAVVVWQRAGHRSLVLGDAGPWSPDGQFAPELRGEDVVVPRRPFRQDWVRGSLDGERRDSAGAGGKVRTPCRMRRRLGRDAGEPGEWTGLGEVGVRSQLGCCERNCVRVPSGGVVQLRSGRRGPGLRRRCGDSGTVAGKDAFE